MFIWICSGHLNLLYSSDFGPLFWFQSVHPVFLCFLAMNCTFEYCSVQLVSFGFTKYVYCFPGFILFICTVSIDKTRNQRPPAFSSKLWLAKTVPPPWIVCCIVLVVQWNFATLKLSITQPCIHTYRNRNRLLQPP